MATVSTTSSDPRIPGHSLTQWAVDLIGAINQYGFHIPVNATSVGILLAWANVESGGYNPNVSGGRFNPLNTTETSQGGKAGQGGSQGNIADFATYEDGIRNQAYNLARAGGSGDSFGYRRIISAMESGVASAVFSAIDASSFGTHFGSGASPIPVTKLPGGQFIPIGKGGGGSTPADLLVDLTPGFDLPDWIPKPWAPLFEAADFGGKVSGLFLGLFRNWRYLAEVVFGLNMIGLGFLLIGWDIMGGAKGVAGITKTAATKGAA